MFEEELKGSNFKEFNICYDSDKNEILLEFKREKSKHFFLQSIFIETTPKTPWFYFGFDKPLTSDYLDIFDEYYDCGEFPENITNFKNIYEILFNEMIYESLKIMPHFKQIFERSRGKNLLEYHSEISYEERKVINKVLEKLKKILYEK